MKTRSFPRNFGIERWLTEKLWGNGKVLTTAQFAEKYGDPRAYSYRGQFYDSRKASTACICGRHIRFCFLVLTPTGSKITIGSCCFKFFLPLAEVLEASQVLLLHTTLEEMKAIRETQLREAAASSRTEWNKLRREALKRISAYHKATGKEWLPEVLFDLKVALEASLPQGQPNKRAVRWLRTKAEVLKKKLATADACLVLSVRHEENALNQN
jgi:hypothetical protein